ncbi:Crp/Fnr family transcriptional regulator [Flavobacterium sp. 3-218]
MYKELRKNIERHIQISDEQFEVFSSNFHPISLKKKDFLLHKGAICNFEAFVVKGCLRVFYEDESGSEQILYFAIEDWWATDIDSFMNQVPSILSIEALEDCELLLIKKKDKDNLYECLPIVEKLFRIMNQKTLVAFQRRLISSHGQTADLRYLKFLEKYPSLPQRITQQQIASYLGISHEFLSKIRKRINKG